MAATATSYGPPADASVLNIAWRRWRNRLVGDTGFQRWVARIPLVRMIARRQAASLFELCAGFIHSQVLYATVKLGLLEALRDGPKSLLELQRYCALPLAQLRLLVAASDALGLTQRSRGEGSSADGTEACGLGLLGAALLGNAAVLRMIEHQPLLYADLGDPILRLQGTAPAGALEHFWAYARNSSGGQLEERAVSAYSTLMAATNSLVSEDLLAAYPFARHRCLLDVGGGEGEFLRVLGRRVPSLNLMLFDLPAVVERARVRLGSADIASRTQLFGGDFATTALPTGADVISLIRVLHDHDEDTVLALLQAVRRALPPGGSIVIAEPMRGVAGSVPAAETYLGFYLLAMGQGRMRSTDELAKLLRAAGFTHPRQHRTARPWQCAVLSATAGISVNNT